MGSRTIRIGVINGAPYTTKCAFDEDCPARGIGVDAARIVCDHLPWPCQFSWFDGKDYGDADENGQNATGMVGAIAQGQYDTSLPHLTPTYRRNKAISFTGNYFLPNVVLMTRASTGRHLEGTPNWNVITTWQWQVWVCFIVFLAITSSFIILNTALLRLTAKISMPTRYLDNVLLLLNIEDRYHNLERGSLRFSIGLWTLGMIVLTAAYTGTIFSRAVVDTTQVPFTDIESFVGCVKRRECRLITETMSISYIQGLTSTESTLGRRTRAAFEVNPPLITKTVDEIPSQILKERRVYLVWMRSENTVSITIAAYPPCLFWVVHTDIYDSLTFPVRKNDTLLLEELNKISIPFREQRLDQQVLTKYIPGRMGNCGNDVAKNVPQVSIDSINVSLYFFLFGSVGSILVLGVEVAIAKWRSNIAHGVDSNINTVYVKE